MAGKGTRFKKLGNNIHKPLIKVDGKPMFIKSSETFSKFYKWIFIAPKNIKHEKSFIDSLSSFKNKKLILIKKTTAGQASTVYKARKILKKNQLIIIHSCDLKFNFTLKELITKIKKYDILVFTAKCNKFHIKNHKQFSWVKKSDVENEIIISCKSNFKNNKRKNRVLIGSFVFKNKQIFTRSANYVFKNKFKINNEYYLDTVAAKAKKLGYKVGEISVKNYISWGTYSEFLNYQIMKN